MKMHRQQTQYLQRLTLLAVGATTLAMWIPAIDVFNFPKQAVLIGFIFPIAGFTILRKTYNCTRSQIVAYWLLIILVAQVLTSGVKWGISKPEILWGVFSRANGILTMIAFIFLAMISFHLSDKYFIRKISKVAMIILAFEVIYGVMQWLGKDPIDWVNPYSPIILTVGNPNFAASLLSVLSILNLANITLSNRFSVKNISISLLSATGIFLSYLTSSIQGIVGIGAAGFLLVVILTMRSNKPVTTKLLIFGILFAFSTPILAGLLNYGPLAARIYQYTLAVRAQYWQVGLEIIKSQPFFGVGADQYGDYFLRYRKPEFVEKYGFFLFTNNAHNSVIQWGSTVGLLASIVIVTLFVLAIYRTLRTLFAVQTLDLDLTLIFLAWIAYTLQSLISIEQIGIAVWGWLLSGVLLGYSANQNEVASDSINRKRKKDAFIAERNDLSIQQLLLAPLIVLALIPASSFVKADVELKQSFQIPGGTVDTPEGVNRGNFVLQKANRFLGMRDYTNLVIKNFLAVGPIPFAQRAAEIATQKNPDNSETWNWLSETRARSGDIAGSIRALEQSVSLDPLNDSNAMIIAKRYFELGDTKNAKKWAQGIRLSSDPTIRVAAQQILDSGR